MKRKLFTKEQHEALMKALSGLHAKDFITKATEGDKDPGSFKVIISTGDEDRHGEQVRIDAWDLKHYMKNPVVLFGHNYNELPIGVADKVYVQDGKLIAEGRFASEEANPKAQQIRRLYDAKMIRTTSVGFIAKEFDPDDRNIIINAELLEFSFVPVPANPHALDMMKDLGMDIADLKAKGFILEDVKHGEPVENNDANVETDKKGAVSEEVEDLDEREQKWNLFEPVDEIVSALYRVYFNEETPVGDFNKLLGEAVALLVALGANTEEKSAVLDALIKSKSITGMNLSIVKEVEQEANKPKVSEEESPASEPADEDAEPDTEDVEGDADTTQESKDFHELRKLLKSSTNATSEALRMLKNKK